MCAAAAIGTLAAMERRTAATGMVVASMIFGVTVAVLAMADSGALSYVAMIGGVLVGIGWMLVGLVARGDRGPGA